MTKKLPAAELILLALAALLVPLMGGQMVLRSLPVENGAQAFLSVFGGPELPTVSHLVIALLVSLAGAAVLMRRRILQIPEQRLGGIVIVFFALLAVSVAHTSYRAVSMRTLSEWAIYAVAFFVTVAVSGRRAGPTIIIGSLFIGCFLQARAGILSYRASGDPTWRIFASWVDPNALAGMLIIGLMLGMGLVLTIESPSPLLLWTGRLVSWIGCVAIGAALILTGSKGGLIAVLLGFSTFSLALGIRKGISPVPAILLALGVLALAVPVALGRLWLPCAGIFLAAAALALVFSRGFVRLGNGVLICTLAFVPITAQLLQAKPAPAPPADVATSAPAAPDSKNSFSRIANSGTTSDQSFGFRALLWKSAIKIGVAEPAGTGLGTFKYNSAKPGLTVQTVLAHDSYLQLWSECSLLAMALLIFVIAYVLFLATKQAINVPEKLASLKIGVISALVAAAIHNLVDGDLYVFGTGLSLFILLGLALTLSTDAVAPEFTPKLVRTACVIFCFVPVAALTYFGYGEYLRASFLQNLSSQNRVAANDDLDQLKSLYADDGETWNMAASMASNPEDLIRVQERACQAVPSPSNFRALARTHRFQKQYLLAEQALGQALRSDPNNLPALNLLMHVQAEGENLAGAEATAKRLIGVESKPYFQVRSLPELVPTETYDARIFLAGKSGDAKEQARLLSGAVAGYREYLDRTVPPIKDAASQGFDYAGLKPKDALDILTEARDAATGLATAYRTLGAPDKAAEAEREAKAFEDAAGRLRNK